MPARLTLSLQLIPEGRISGVLHASKYLHAIQSIASDYLQSQFFFGIFSDDVYRLLANPRFVAKTSLG